MKQNKEDFADLPECVCYQNKPWKGEKDQIDLDRVKELTLEKSVILQDAPPLESD